MVLEGHHRINFPLFNFLKLLFASFVGALAGFVLGRLTLSRTQLSPYVLKGIKTIAFFTEKILLLIHMLIQKSTIFCTDDSKTKSVKN